MSTAASTTAVFVSLGLSVGLALSALPARAELGKFEQHRLDAGSGAYSSASLQATVVSTRGPRIIARLSPEQWAESPLAEGDLVHVAILGQTLPARVRQGAGGAGPVPDEVDVVCLVHGGRQPWVEVYAPGGDLAATLQPAPGTPIRFDRP